MNEAPQQTELENLWGYRKRLHFVRRAVAESCPDRQTNSLHVLDVGCGNGSQLALPLVKDGFNFTGIDTDSASIEHARRLAAYDTNARFLCARIEDISDTEVFDVVILSEVLEHVIEPLILLKAGLRHLGANGVMIVTVPNGYGEFEIDSWLFRTLRLQRVVDALASRSKEVVGSTDNQENGHVQFFTRTQLYGMFDECGLKIFRVGVSSLISGPIAGHIFGRSAKFIEWNVRTADKLPPIFSSGWFFALRHSKIGQG